MYGSFEGWYHSNKYPWETRSDAKARYESVYGEDDEELEVVDTPAFSYEPEKVEEEAEGFLDETGEPIIAEIEPETEEKEVKAETEETGTEPASAAKPKKKRRTSKVDTKDG